MDHVKLKILQTQISKVETELQGLNQERDLAKQRASSVRKRLSALNAEKERLTNRNNKIIVSEHAILRYLERVRGIDMEIIKSEILPEDANIPIQKLGSGTYPVDNAHKLVIRNNVVVTVLSAKKEMNEEKSS